MDIEEKYDILSDLFSVYHEVCKSFNKLSQNFSDLQKAFLGRWGSSFQKESKLMTYSNFVNSLRRDMHSHLWVGYSENLIDLCILEYNLRTIILKITGFLLGYENKEEKFEPTSTNSDNSDLSSERTSNSSQN